jgi:hypothetical protein
MLFGSSYLDFFWPSSLDDKDERNFLQEMCNAINIEQPRERENWKTTAKSVAVPKKGPTRDFHLRLRESDVMKNENKKNIVNESFDFFLLFLHPLPVVAKIPLIKVIPTPRTPYFDIFC